MDRFLAAVMALGWVTGCADPGDDTAAIDPFADGVISIRVGEGGGFGVADLPGVVLGPPVGAGDRAGSTDVVSLGRAGGILLVFDDLLAVDGEGPDIVVFENAFDGWVETGRVAASPDGVEWAWWPCDAVGPGHAGCAGVTPVWSNPGNGIDPTDPTVAGGDAFDLADIGLATARFVHVRDSGENAYTLDAGGFDLDAVAIVHGDVP